MAKRLSESGIRPRHSRAGGAYDGTGRCTCEPSWIVTISAGSREAKRRITSFPTIEAARTWLAVQLAVKNRDRVTTRGPSFRQSMETWLDAVDSGRALTRSTTAYKPSVARDYRKSMERHRFPAFGGKYARDIEREGVQRMLDESTTGRDGRAVSASTVRNAPNAIRAWARWAARRRDADPSLGAGLDLPSVRSARRRAADKSEVWSLIDAVPAKDRHVCALACFAGLRLGKIRGLRWSDIDDDVIRVERSYSEVVGTTTTPKSRAGIRDVPLPAALREILEAAPQASGENVWRGSPRALQVRADAAWSAAGLTRITPHEGRHTYASLSVASGVEIDNVSRFMGHSSISITMDLYRHLYPEARRNAAAKFNSLLSRQARETHARSSSSTHRASSSSPCSACSAGG